VAYSPQIGATDIDGVRNRKIMEGEYHTVSDFGGIFFGVRVRRLRKFKIESERVGNISTIPARSEPNKRKRAGVDSTVEHLYLSFLERKCDVSILPRGVLYREGKFLERFLGAGGRRKAQKAEEGWEHSRESSGNKEDIAL
jgi:hypothetical protein